SFCGSDGVEIMEPLSFKGRRGSGIAGDRCAYADASLSPRWDWQKYAYTYRVWGRLLYNPEAEPDVWRRYLATEFGAAAPSFEAARWIEDHAAAAARHLTQAEARAVRKDRPEHRRLATDVAIQAGLGKFFGAKMRSGVLFRIHEKTGDRTALEESLKAYRAARASWEELANRAKVYVSDITVGELQHLRGHWRDRLPAMDAD